MRRFVGVERARQAGLDVAEGAGARAGVAHDHEGGVLLLPALADIRAAGLLAHGVQPVFAHDALRFEIARRYRRLDADPVGFLGDGRIRPVRLFRMARTRVGHVEDDGHGSYLRLPTVRRKAHKLQTVMRGLDPRIPLRKALPLEWDGRDGASAMTNESLHALFAGNRLPGVELEIFNSSSDMSAPMSPNSGVDR